MNLAPYGSESHPALLAIVSSVIACLDGGVPIEVQRFLEIDTMLGEVRGLFPLVPVVSRRQIVYTLTRPCQETG